MSKERLTPKRKAVNNGEKHCFAPEDCYWRISDTNICTSPDKCDWNKPKTEKPTPAEKYFLKRYPLYKDIKANELTFFRKKFFEMLTEFARQEVEAAIAERMPTEEVKCVSCKMDFPIMETYFNWDTGARRCWTCQVAYLENVIKQIEKRMPTEEEIISKIILLTQKGELIVGYIEDHEEDIIYFLYGRSFKIKELIEFIKSKCEFRSRMEEKK
jgi:hypothetical protein